ncbi:hypothetical protein [Pseudomonas sp. NPDC089569]|uniref:hypothetical protein n=1 Tax=Pseudomonas sp. NPDC089569 TaxID=3390722 RepID=UPI003D0091C0
MKRSLKPLHRLSAITVLLGLSAWVTIDTSAYRAAMRELGTPEMVRFIEQKKNDTEADVHRLWACSDQGSTDDEYSARARSCVIDAMSKTSTTVGGMTSGYIGYQWLTKNPNDAELRAAALSAIAKGRIDLRASKLEQYDRFQNVVKANDQSIFLRFIKGRQNTSDMFDKTADQLDQVEYMVMLPEVSRAQHEWRLKTYASE